VQAVTHASPMAGFWDLHQDGNIPCQLWSAGELYRLHLGRFVCCFNLKGRMGAGDGGGVHERPGRGRGAGTI